MDNHDIIQIAKLANLTPVKVGKFSNKAYYFTTANHKFIIKEMDQKAIDIYQILKYVNANIFYENHIIKYLDKTYYIYLFLDNKGEEKTKIPHIKEELKQVHSLTRFDVSLKKKEYQNLTNLYKILDSRFSLIEMNMRILETSSLKGDYTWVYLSKYNIILEAKKIMEKLQNKLHKDIEASTDLTYALNHSNPSVSHFKDKYIINYNNAYFGFVVSDIAKFYVENDHIEINWYEIINPWLNEYKKDIYKTYFKFLVLYIYILNINTETMLNYESLNKYIQITNKISNFCTVFKNYK